MSDNKEILLDILCEILGDPEKVYDSKLQYGYNCPECGLGERKGNLEVSLEKHVYHCWSCGNINDTHGSLGRLFDKYGTKQQKKLYEVIRPEQHKPKEKQVKKLTLPENFKLFKDVSKAYPIRRVAYNYLISRGITDDIINKFKIGFCDSGSHSGRIVVPSYNEFGGLNYYVARSWYPNTKAKYKNPETPKDEIIFNESLINWNQDIFLVEGVFDSFFIPNSIPMLGKHMSELLFTTLYNRAMGNVIIGLDGDAFNDGVKLYHELNGGGLYGKIKILKLPIDKDICDLKGDINEYYYNMR